MQTQLASPPPPVDAEPEVRALAPASVVTGRRIAAGLIDFVPMIFLMWAIGDREGASVRLTGMPILWWTLAGIVYYLISEAVTGTSPGKGLLGLCVRKTDTSPAAVGQILARTAGRPVDLIGFYLLGLVVALTSEKRQRIGDRIAGTVVLQRAHVTEEPMPKRNTLFLAAMVLAVLVASSLFYAQSRDAENRLGAFDIKTEVVPFADEVVATAFTPASETEILGQIYAGLITGPELNDVLSSAEEQFGSFEAPPVFVDSFRGEAAFSNRDQVEMVDVLYDVDYTKQSGRFVVTIALIDDELVFIGFQYLR